MRKILLPMIVFGLLLTGVGCEEDAGTLPGNFPPATYLSVIGADLDTTDYRKILHWWGSDRDGEVAGYMIRWDGRDYKGRELASGVYLYRLQAGSQVQTRKMVLVR